MVIARLHSPANLGSNSHEVQFVILVMAPVREVSAKSLFIGVEDNISVLILYIYIKKWLKPHMIDC